MTTSHAALSEGNLGASLKGEPGFDSVRVQTMTAGESHNKVVYQDSVASMIVEILPDLRFAYVFGSAARDDLGPHSDYDVAVDAGRALDITEILQLSGRLESIVGRNIDLVDLNAAGPVLKMQVLQNGHLISRQDRRALAEFQMYTPSQYEDWKHLSKPLDEALIRRFQS